MARSIRVVAAEEHRFLVTASMQAAGVEGDLVLEPLPRNTAAAMALAALAQAEIASNELLLFCPADHHIPDAVAFSHTVQRGVAAARAGAIVTFGVVPTFPSTAYGYIQRGETRVDGSHNVIRFIEKPDETAATGLLLQGDVFWNAGIFLCQADTLLNALQRHAPDILESCRQATSAATRDCSPEGMTFIRPDSEAFSACRAQSIDYAVLEAHDNVATVPFAGQWSDVGSWNAVAALTPSDEKGNRIDGRGVLHEAERTYIHAPERTVVALGTRDLLIIDTPDALLVADTGSAEQVRSVVERLTDLGAAEAVTHRKVARPWGWYDSLESGPGFQVKRIGVKPGAALSLQYHHRRAEHWVVVSGTAEVTRGEEVLVLTANQSTYIPVGERHRLRNIGEGELQIIEVQSGEYLGEDDIVRLDDDYGRSGT
jgi:mannose-1-phosphate guanylyltransferase/mannose-6-phosphate isomerase